MLYKRGFRKEKEVVTFFVELRYTEFRPLPEDIEAAGRFRR